MATQYSPDFLAKKSLNKQNVDYKNFSPVALFKQHSSPFTMQSYIACKTQLKSSKLEQYWQETYIINTHQVRTPQCSLFTALHKAPTN